MSKERQYKMFSTCEYHKGLQLVELIDTDYKTRLIFFIKCGCVIELWTYRRSICWKDDSDVAKGYRKKVKE